MWPKGFWKPILRNPCGYDECICVLPGLLCVVLAFGAAFVLWAWSLNSELAFKLCNEECEAFEGSIGSPGRFALTDVFRSRPAVELQRFFGVVWL